MPGLEIPAAEQEHFDAAELMPPAEIAAFQLAALQRVLRRADRLPFYKRRFSEAGLAGRRIASFADYSARVPVIRKADLVEATRAQGTARAGIEALGRHRLTNIVMTSGTLGFNTFAFLTRADLLGSSFRNGLRELWSVRVRPGMRVLTLSPAWHALALLDTRALTALGARVIMPAGTFAPRFVPNFLDAIRLHQPEHLLLTAPVLRGLLDHSQRQGEGSPDRLGSLRYVACAGESLSPAYRRHVIKQLGLEDLYERGGSSDGMFGGGECFAHRGHHISGELHYIEVVDPRDGSAAEPGERGCSVVTNLTGGRSVYIRFNTEDVAALVPGACPCGRTDPVIEFYGRLADSVLLADRIVAPADIRNVLDTFPALMAVPFSVEQAGSKALKVKLGTAQRPDTLAAASEAIGNKLGINVTISAAEELEVGWKGRPMRKP